MGLKDYKFYRDLKVLKRMIRDTVIRVMPKAHKYPDAIYLKEHLGAVVRYTAAMYVTEDVGMKCEIADSILFELYVIQDEIEDQEEAMVVSIKQAASIYAQIQEIIQSIMRFKQYLNKKRESEGLRTGESAVK